MSCWPIAEFCRDIDVRRRPVELFLTVSRPSGRDDVTVVVDPEHTVRELAQALAPDPRCGPDRMAVTSLRTGRRLRPDDTVLTSGVLSGDELSIGPTSEWRDVPVRDLGPEPVITLDITAGPDTGRSILLRRGRHDVGRGADVQVSIDDRSVSRRHLAVTVDDDGNVTVEPASDAKNGVTVNDVDISVTTAVCGDDVVGLGGTRLLLRRFVHTADEHVDRLGRMGFHRTPYRPPVVSTRPSPPIGPIPERPEPRRLQLLAVLAPLAAGVAMYAVTRQVQFLALTLISPIVMIANAIDERRSGRRSFRRDLVAFRERLVVDHDRLDRLRHVERLERLRAAPDLADLLRRVELRTVDLWSRGRTAPDVLVTRLGLGSSVVHHAVELQRGGAEDLRAEALAAIAGLDRLENVPVTVDLCDDAVVGIHGDRGVVDGVVSSIVVQAATLHSPEDLTIAAAMAPERPLQWLKWLPHVRSVASPLSGAHLATTTDDADLLIHRLIDVAVFRLADRRDRAGDRFWPRILVLLDAELVPDAAAVARLLDLAPLAGISVVWSTSNVAGVPRHATRTLEVGRHTGDAMIGRLWSTDPSVPDLRLEVEHLRPALAERAARSMAPVRDASTASATTSIPRIAPLLDVLGVGLPTATWVVDRWRQGTRDGLRFPIGIGADGPVDIDLVHDGPHALIGGTSGAGKSELLQSMVAALASLHSPTQLNFLFVDYKGGASSQVFERLPHTVGYVTNLSADLSLRAITSLRAELHRRMALLEGRAKDLAEMRDVAPDEAPPSLVIVVDEFATLAKEVPGFVDGIIDIAQRGRSLGIHLVLATQRPAGAVNENILANTNLRISFRMLDRADSTSVIDSPAAAEIPVPLRGRGLVRRGPRHLVEFQSAYAGAPMTGVDSRRPILVRPFSTSDLTVDDDATSTTSHGPVSQLTVLLDAIGDANDDLQLTPPRRPWREVLPPVVTLDSILGDDHSDIAVLEPGRFVAVGVVDVPEHQLQHAAVVDLESGGGLLVFGSGASGKTTLLRTVATALDRCAGHGEVATLVFDFASRGLAAVRALPTVIDVATGDDLESVTRHLQVLDTELGRRRHLVAEAGAEDIGAYNVDAAANGRDPIPRIVVLIDGFGGLASSLFGAASGLGVVSAEDWSDLVTRVVIDGRRVGIHSIITADRRAAVPARLHAAIAHRIVLRHADDASYADHGVSAGVAAALEAIPGRALLDATTLMQVACVAADPSARAQSDAIADVAATSLTQPAAVLTSASLPLRVSLDALIDAGMSVVASADRRLVAIIGVADVTGLAVEVDLEWSSFTVAGPPRSGRSTALAATAIQLRGRNDVWVLGSLASPLARLGFDQGAFGRAVDLVSVVERLADRVARSALDDRLVIVFDDVDMFDDAILHTVLDRLVTSDTVRLVGSVELRSMTGYTTSPAVNALRRARRQLVLQPDDPSEFVQATGIKLPSRPGLRAAPGRGVLLVDRIPTLVQVAFPDDREMSRRPTAATWS